MQVEMLDGPDREEGEICPYCAGSGEGAYDGAICGACRGRGERGDERDDGPDEDDRFDDPKYDSPYYEGD